MTNTLDITAVLTPLSAAQVEVERHAAAERSGMAPDRIVIGRCGLPPLLSPTTRVAGLFHFPTYDDVKLSVLEAGNPINFLPPELVAQRPGETETLWHLRLSIYLMLAGLLDSQSGQFADLLAVNGFDRSSVEGRAAIVRAMKHDGSARLEDISIDVPYWQQVLVDRYVTEAAPQLESGEVHSEYDVLVVLDGSLARAGRLETTLAAAEQRARADLSGPAGLSGPGVDATLRLLEQHSPRVLEDLLAVAVEARAAHLTGYDPTADFAGAEQRAAAFGRAAVTVAATVKSAPSPAAGWARLEDGLRSARAELDAAGQALHAERDAFLRARKASEHAATQRMAQQLSAPVRGVDFAAGAPPLP